MSILRDIKNSDRLRLAGVLKNRVFIGPEKVSFHLTDTCNLSCIYCWRHSPLNLDVPRGLKKHELDTKYFRKAIDDCCKLGVRRIQFSSQGEPTLHRHIAEMLAYVKSKRLFLTLLTNGTFASRLRNFVKLADEIKIDLSATTQEQYQKIQSPKNRTMFNRVVDNIAFLSSLKNVSKRSPAVKLNFILNAYNYKSLEDAFDLGVRLKVDHLNIMTVSVNDYTGSVSLSPAMLRDVKAACCRMIKNRMLSKISNNLLVNYQKRGDFFNRVEPARACYNGWYHIFVTFKGDVSVCCMTRALFVAGNICRQSLNDIWYSDKFHALRLDGKNGLLSGRIDKCRKCCFHKFNNELYEKLGRYREIGYASK